MGSSRRGGGLVDLVRSCLPATNDRFDNADLPLVQPRLEGNRFPVPEQAFVPFAVAGAIRPVPVEGACVKNSVVDISKRS
jgi:hypothetical protein